MPWSVPGFARDDLSSCDAFDLPNDFEQKRRLDVECRPFWYGAEQIQHLLRAALAAANRAQEDA